MSTLGVQYYRAPFPLRARWDDDFRRIADSGLHAVQLWVLWGWVEAQPERWRFEDYDELMGLAEKHNLKVVLSTIAEIQPIWIHREVPGSELITSDGQPVVSFNRAETHFGVTPGGCFDHPDVWRRMQDFLIIVSERYKDAPALHGWDAWNELRWSVNAKGRVCYCPHTVRSWHAWLDERFGGLQGLNKAWLRRYGTWDEVQPGREPNRPFTEMMSFCHFLTHRANIHARARYLVVKRIDPHHPVTVHGGDPTPLYFGWGKTQPLDRGNDWDFADTVDGIGCSSFPKWFGLDDAAFGARVEYVRSAARGKKVWLSEVQGGRAASGFQIFDPVQPDDQQRWIWNGLACGADTILFWCWRDEVFGRESSGFGLAGNDGWAEERLAAMRQTRELLDRHAALLDQYKPVEAAVGVLFSPQTYYMHYALEETGRRARQALEGYTRALVRLAIPYTVVEEEHLDRLDELQVLFMPRVLVTHRKTEAALERFVRNGGTLVVESEAGAFSPEGFYRYVNERFLPRLAPFAEVGRRALGRGRFDVRVGEHQASLSAAQWTTPYVPDDANAPWDVRARDEAGEALVVRVPVGEGAVVGCGTYFGEAYAEDGGAGFEAFIDAIVSEAQVQLPARVVTPERTRDAFVYVKCGAANGRRMVFVFLPPDTTQARLRFPDRPFAAGKVRDLFSGRTLSLEDGPSGQECTVAPGRWRMALLCE